LEPREHVLQIVERLDPWIDARHGHLARRGGDDPDAALVERRRIHCDVGDDDDDPRARARRRIEAERAVATRHDETDVAVALAVGTHGLTNRLRELRAIEG